jgi:type IV pilus assembly protein PilE
MHMRKERGFTLIELMIVVAIIAILASLAIAGYGYANRKTARAAAQACMVEAAQRTERFYTTNMTYAGAPAPSCSADLHDRYVVNFVGAPDASSYTIRAVPQGPQSGDSCGTMTIDETGAKTPGPDTKCW